MKKIKDELPMLVLAVAVFFWTVVLSGELPIYLFILALLGAVYASLYFALLYMLKMKRPCEDCPHTTEDSHGAPPPPPAEVLHNMGIKVADPMPGYEKDKQP